MNITEYCQLQAKAKDVTKTEIRRDIADAINVSEALVKAWCYGWKRIVPEHAIPLYFATDRMVTPHESCPTIYPDPAWLPTKEMMDRVAA